MSDGVSFLEQRNEKLEEQLKNYLAREHLLADAEQEKSRLLEELAVVSDERDLLEQNSRFKSQLQETQIIVNDLLIIIDGTRLQGLLTNQHTGEPIQLRWPDRSKTLVTAQHAISLTSDASTTSSGTMTLQGSSNVALPRVMCVFLDHNQQSITKNHF